MTTHMPTVTLEMLKRFCATEGDDPREYLYAPMLIEGWLCATNGHVVVGIAPISAAEAVPAALAPIAKGISPIRQMWEQVTEDQWRPWTDLDRCPQTPPTCDCCQGSGWVTVTQCDHCEGEGDFFCTTACITNAKTATNKARTGTPPHPRHPPPCPARIAKAAAPYGQGW